MHSILRITLLSLAFFLLLAVSGLHKYYVSVTNIDYVKDKQQVQITCRLFIDDFEKLLRERYNSDIVLNIGEDETKIDKHIEDYVKSKLVISINNTTQTLSFIGKEYEDNILYCYLEIDDVEAISTFEVSNSILFDMFSDQKNIVKTYIYKKHKSFLFIPEKFKGLLNF